MPTDPADSSDASTARIVVDPGLLAILPSRIAGVAVNAAPESAARMIEDESLDASASAVAVGIAAAPGASGGDELAVATVIQLRPGVYNDGFHDRWRAAYDQAACAAAGGVASHLQQVIGAHRVDVTLCTGGARTYHVHLPGDRLVSVTSVGDGRFGDLLLAGLRE